MYPSELSTSPLHSAIIYFSTFLFPAAIFLSRIDS